MYEFYMKGDTYVLLGAKGFKNCKISFLTLYVPISLSSYSET